jgi:hypothetical protein
MSTEEIPTIDDATRESERSAVMAQFEEFDPSAGLPDDEPAEAATEPEEAPVEEPTEEAETPAEEQGEPEEATGETTDEEEAAQAAEVEDEPEPDAAIAKNLEAVKRQERRAREAIAKERADIQREIEEWKPRIEAAQKFESLKGSAWSRSEEVLAELGVTDVEGFAKHIYKRTKDPAATAADARTREAETRLEKLERQNRELLERIESQQVQQQAQQYLDDVSKAVSDDAPTLGTLLKNNPTRARERLRVTTLSLIEKMHGETPEPADVVAELEKQLAIERKELGLGPAPKPTPTKKTTPVAGERSGKSLTGDLGNPTKPRPEPETREELLARTLAELEQGSFE